MPSILLIALLLFIGFSSGCMIVGFAFAKESVPARLAGTVSGVVNMGVMTGPMLLQPGVGVILDRNWSGDVVDGVKQFSLSAYQAGFSLLLGWLALSLLLILFSREANK